MADFASPYDWNADLLGKHNVGWGCVYEQPEVLIPCNVKILSKGAKPDICKCRSCDEGDNIGFKLQCC